jgi:hypothetical protein
MSLLCLAGKHAVRPGGVWNQGLNFSRCRRCGRDMVRVEAKWQPAPRGFRIVWKPVMRPWHADARDVVRNLPMVIPREPVEFAPTVASPAPKGHPAGRRFELAELLFLGVRLLAWYGAAGFGKWRRNLATLRLRRQAPMLMLAR